MPITIFCTFSKASWPAINLRLSKSNFIACLYQFVLFHLLDYLSISTEATSEEVVGHKLRDRETSVLQCMIFTFMLRSNRDKKLYQRVFNSILL